MPLSKAAILVYEQKQKIFKMPPTLILIPFTISKTDTCKICAKCGKGGERIISERGNNVASA